MAGTIKENTRKPCQEYKLKSFALHGELDYMASIDIFNFIFLLNIWKIKNNTQKTVVGIVALAKL